MKTIYCLIGDDYLYGATENPRGANIYSGYWQFTIEEENDSKTDFYVREALVDDLAARAFLDHGTEDQVFSDGYDAFTKLTKEDKKKEIIRLKHNA